MEETNNSDAEVRELDYVDLTIREDGHEIRYTTEIDGRDVQYWELKDSTNFYMQIVDEEQGRTFLFHEHSHGSSQLSDELCTYNDEVDAFYDIDNEELEEQIDAYLEDPSGLPHPLEEDIVEEKAQTEVATIYARPPHGSDDDIVDEDVLDRASEIYNQYRKAIRSMMDEESTRRKNNSMNGLEAIDIGSSSHSGG